MSDTTAPTTVPRSVPAGRRSRVGLGARAAVLLVALLGTLLVGTASPAAASTTGLATACFKHANGAAYTYDQFAQRWTGSAWVNAGTARSINGCVRWTVGAGQYWRFQAFTRVGTAYFLGTSQWALVGAGANLHYGTHLVGYYRY